MICIAYMIHPSECPKCSIAFGHCLGAIYIVRVAMAIVGCLASRKHWFKRLQLNFSNVASMLLYIALVALFSSYAVHLTPFQLEIKETLQQILQPICNLIIL